MVPGEVAARVTKELEIPTIGIDAGNQADSQVMVWQDAFGLNSGRLPRFVKQYSNLHGMLLDAARSYAVDVKDGSFPDPNTPSEPGPRTWNRSEPKEDPCSMPLSCLPGWPGSAGCRSRRQCAVWGFVNEWHLLDMLSVKLDCVFGSKIPKGERCFQSSQFWARRQRAQVRL